MARRRHSTWTPVIISNRGDQTNGHANVSKADDWELAPEDTTKILDRKIQRRADLRFAIGVALALALPAFIGLAVYGIP
jgi:hypothetical protein